MDPQVTDSNQPDAKAGFEELLEDVFGLNIRTFRSLKTLLVRPADYFRAAKTLDWKDQSFTPSPRLWLAIIALTVATRFIWGDPDGAFMQAMQENLERGFKQGAGEKADKFASFDWPAIIERIFNISMFVQPFIIIAMIMLLAVFIRFWGERLNYVVRLRYLFAIIIPASAVNFVITLGLVALAGNAVIWVSLVQVAVIFVLYTCTALLGPFKGQPRDSAIPKSIVLAIILFVVVIIANFAAQTIATGLVLIPLAADAVAASA